MPLTSAERSRIIAAFNAIDPLEGWDWSRLRVRRATAPWDYIEIVRSLLRPTDHVLDIGTGGGEKLIGYVDHCASVVGIDSDPEMIKTANENLPPDLAGRISFQVGDANAPEFENESFDTVLNRHSVVNPVETVRVLRPGGTFVHQNVGSQNLKALVDPWRDMGDLELQDALELRDQFVALGCEVLDFREYDVEYVFLDEESLLFQLKAMPMPVSIDAERDAELIAEVIESTKGPDGAFHSNEHRFLTVVRRAG